MRLKKKKTTFNSLGSLTTGNQRLQLCFARGVIKACLKFPALTQRASRCYAKVVFQVLRHQMEGSFSSKTLRAKHKNLSFKSSLPGWVTSSQF